MNFVRLPIEGTKNTRDLGGYPTKDGKVTKFHIFVRSDNLINITDKDNEFLKDYGISDIIDFRGNTSIQSTFVSDDNINNQYFKFHYIPLSNKEFDSLLFITIIVTIDAITAVIKIVKIILFTKMLFEKLFSSILPSQNSLLLYYK